MSSRDFTVNLTKGEDMLLKSKDGETMQLQLTDEKGKAIELAAAKLPPSIDIEMGAGGVSYFQGIINSDEFNSKLTGVDGVINFDKMRRTDAQVAAFINAIVLNILAATFTVERPENKEEASKITDEHLEFVRDNLFTRISFPDFLRHALTSIWAGFSFFEKIYELEDNKYKIDALAPRLASSLYKWDVDGRGNLEGIVQRVRIDEKTQDITIPKSKIVLFTFQKEGNNHEGMSLLRPSYRHYLIKDTMYKIDAIRHERFAIGVPCITVPDMYDETAINLAKNIGKNWRGAEQSYVIKFPDWDIEILQVKGGESLDLIPTIQHHNEEMAKAALAQFVNFGTTQTGSRALGESSQEFFIDAMEGLAHWICSVIKEEVIYPLMDVNFAGEIRPTIICSDMGTVSLNDLTRALRVMGEMYIQPDDNLENYLRRKLDLPLLEEGTVRTPEPEPEEDTPVRATKWDKFVEKYVDIELLQTQTSEAAVQINRNLHAIIDEWEDEVIINTGVIKVIVTQLNRMYELGRGQVIEELQRQEGLDLTKLRTHDRTFFKKQAEWLGLTNSIGIKESSDLMNEYIKKEVTNLALIIESDKELIGDEELREVIINGKTQQLSMQWTLRALTLGRDLTAQKYTPCIQNQVIHHDLSRKTGHFNSELGQNEYYQSIKEAWNRKEWFIKLYQLK